MLKLSKIVLKRLILVFEMVPTSSEEWKSLSNYTGKLCERYDFEKIRVSPTSPLAVIDSNEILAIV